MILIVIVYQTCLGGGGGGGGDVQMKWNEYKIFFKLLDMIMSALNRTLAFTVHNQQ